MQLYTIIADWIYLCQFQVYEESTVLAISYSLQMVVSALRMLS